MPSTRPEDFLSTVRTTAARPGQVLDVVVLSSDATLLEALRSGAGSEHALWDVPSADAAVDYLVGGRCDVLIADVGTLGGAVAALIDRLQAQFPELIFMATGRREEEGAVASLLSSGRLYRFLHKPVSPGRAFQFLNAATRRYNELGDIPVARQSVRTIAGKRAHFGKVAAAAGGIVAAVVAFVIWQSRDQGLPATLQTTQVADAPVEDVVKSKLGSAQIAYLSGRLLDPRGDNALEYYRAVLALQADNAEAKAGVQKVIDTLEQRVLKGLQERNAPGVVKAWTALQRAAPDHPRLDALRAQLLALSRTAPAPSPAAVASNSRPTRAESSTQVSASSRAGAASSNISSAGPGSARGDEVAAVVTNVPGPELAAADVAERELAEAIARELAEQEAASNAASLEQVADVPVEQGPSLAEQLAAVTALRERGALIAPAGNNAFDAVMALRERYPDAEEVRGEQQRLAFLLLDRSRTALAANDIDQAAVAIDRANTLVPGAQAVRALQEQLSAAREQRDFYRNVAAAASLKRVREVPPVYPREAARKGTEGWVQVEFTIAPDGTTQDLQVRDSQPAQVFDKAALDSVSKWRFEPIRRNGAPVAQRAILQVKFVVTD
ncbi:energy transducer TonB [Steroidobacter sp. S1-65]|uniref:Protein TonB n=1 Tax=Steroidobacter gossypii TaxID=2805490 RepID=A0ABS1WSJ1_9GAMM|nr:energy transducer TonB [Steroidobacter gossypii]MBM0103951.1 energy transducer TonB [Steroidobacter gossypii]